MKQIPLTQGKVALVDDEDFDRLNAHKWCAHHQRRRWYAVRSFKQDAYGRRGLIRMHREIAGLEGLDVDHVNGDGLDNRRVNLRSATRSQNLSAFRRACEDNSSRFRGVSWERRRLKWHVGITHFGKRQNLGYFDVEEDAARAYDTAARRLFGEFAQPNFP